MQQSSLRKIEENVFPYLLQDVEEREDRIREVSLSFPSGHSSFAFQAATFTVLYLQAKFSKGWAKNSLLVPFFQLFVLAVAFYTAISRYYRFEFSLKYMFIQNS